MKPLSAPTELWRFPITGEETWAGVQVCRTPALDTGFIHSHRRSQHGTPTQAITLIPPGQA